MKTGTFSNLAGKDYFICFRNVECMLYTGPIIYLVEVKIFSYKALFAKIRACSFIDESQEHCGKEEEPETKDYTKTDSI